MKMRISGFNSFLTFLSQLFILFYSSIALSQNLGGGEITRGSPYRNLLLHERIYMHPDSEFIELVEKIKSYSSFLRNTIDLRPNRIGKFHNIALAHVDEGGKIIDLFHEVYGRSEDDNLEIIDLSVISAFKVIKIERNPFSTDRALLEIIIFPDISPSELVIQVPSYLDLIKNYTRRVKIWVKLNEETNKELSLVGTNYDRIHRIITKIGDIKLNTKIKLGYDQFDYLWNLYENYEKIYDHEHKLNLHSIFEENLGYIDRFSKAIWWATPSVIADGYYNQSLIKYAPPKIKSKLTIGVAVLVSATVLYVLLK